MKFMFIASSDCRNNNIIIMAVKCNNENAGLQKIQYYCFSSALPNCSMSFHCSYSLLTCMTSGWLIRGGPITSPVYCNLHGNPPGLSQ